VLLQRGQVAEAAEHLHHAIRLRPGHINSYIQLANAYALAGYPDEAIEALSRALALDPGLAATHVALANAYKDRGQLERALASLARADALDCGNFAHQSLRLALIPCHAAFNEKLNFAEARAFDRRWGEPLGRGIGGHKNSREPDRRLRIGYLSPYFKEHCQSLFMGPLLSHHDHEKFEIFCYSDTVGSDPQTQRLRELADEWREIRGGTDAQVAEQIRGDEIDILVDLTMHMPGGRPLLFARKTAPVQIAWLAYPGTTGLTAMDWRLSDPYLDPAEKDAVKDPGAYVERTLRLPDTFWCYDPQSAEPAVSALPALSAGHITFGALNNFCKMNEASLVRFARVLTAVPGSRLLLLAPTGSARQWVAQIMAGQGIDASRIEFVNRQLRPQYLETYHRIDIGLDIGPYNGHTTSLDSYWMGVPVVTIVGDTVVGRAGMSQLTNLGLTDLIAKTDDDFVRIAADMAGDLERLKKLRAALRQRMESSPLMDGPKFARGIEAAYRTAWKSWCEAAPEATSGPATMRPGDSGESNGRGPSEVTKTLSGQPSAARQLPEPAPAVAQVLSAALQHHQAGDLAKAQALYREALAINPYEPRALQLLGVSMSQAGDHAAAIELITRAIALAPGQGDFHINLGLVLTSAQKLDEAIADYRAALAMYPFYSEAHQNLGIALRLRGRPAESAAAHRQALKLQPNHPAALNSLGLALMQQGQVEDAIASYRQALAPQPQNPEALNNLGYALMARGQDEEAYKVLRQAIDLRPDFAHAWANLASVMYRQSYYDEAISALTKVLELHPEMVDAQANLANTYLACGRIDLALESFERALRIAPESLSINSGRLFLLHFHSDFDGPAILREHKAWAARFAEPLARLHRGFENEPNAKRRLRVGYVSPDFCEHCQALLVGPLLANHDHQQVELFLYSDVMSPDEYTKRFRGHAEHWRSIVGLTDDQVAEQIRADQIDILVDLTMHMARGRPLLFARKPAPVQVAWLAYPGTTGQSAVDWRITDRYLDPPEEHDDWYAEKSYRLPDTFWCYDPLVEVAVNELPALEKGHITFGSLNNFCKVNDATLARWAKVMTAVAGSRLIMLVPAGSARGRMIEALGRVGIDASRIEFVSRQEREAYLKVYHRIDIGLDTFPYNGHTTSLDSYWMGVPVVTMVGETVVGRAGLSQLTNLGLTDLAAESEEEFVRLAVELARDLPRLGRLRKELRPRMQQSPLMDAKRFAQNMEEAYRSMWQQWCASAASAPRKPGSAARSAMTSGTDHVLGQVATACGQGNIEHGIQLINRALAAAPSVVDYHVALIEMLTRLRRGEEAMAAARRAVALRPADAQLQSHIGMLLAGAGQYAEAITLYEKAMALDPEPLTAYRLAYALQGAGRFEDAVVACERVLAIKPDHHDAMVSLAAMLEKVHRVDEAIAVNRRILALHPDEALSHNNLAMNFQQQGRVSEALAEYNVALALDPNHADINSNRLFVISFCLDFDGPRILSEHKAWAKRVAAPLRHLIRRHANELKGDRRLRIGYVSPDFGDHCQALFTVPLLSNHDHEQVEVFCYASVSAPDVITERLKSYADQWRAVHGMTDEQVAEQIRADKIDILIDLTMHMGRARPLLFARKPAPVQIAWLAYPGTTGLETMDWRFTDPYLDPPGEHDEWYVEKSYRLPDSFWCYHPLTDLAKVNELPALTAGQVTFGGLNNLMKMNQPSLMRWARVMNAVPGSRLLMMAATGSSRQGMIDLFTEEGIDPGRIEFVPRQSRLKYLETYNRIDLAMDLLPYNGHTTSLDSYWMGVPVVTLVGRTVVGRAGLSQLTNLGLTELVAHSEEEFVRITAELAADLPRLAKLRRELRQRMEQSPLMDAKRFARGVESAYRSIWRQWCAGAAADVRP
jgi:predicted O-linked N-acetylglucosamine transferase (SPINDLY family)